jgi:hypothetical protein
MLVFCSEVLESREVLVPPGSIKGTDVVIHDTISECCLHAVEYTSTLLIGLMVPVALEES